MTKCTFPACTCREVHEFAGYASRLAKRMDVEFTLYPMQAQRMHGCTYYERWVYAVDPSDRAEFHLKERWRKYGWHE